MTAASDAFGTSLGLQNVGLYSQNDARGFDPQQAGDLRIEGLYFDQETGATNSCMVRETTMRIGIAAQSYSFPSPTGIADFSLRSPGDHPAFSGLASRGPFNGSTVQLEQQLPLLGNLLSGDFCAGYFRNFLVDNARRDGTAEYAATLRWQPREKTEFLPFASYMAGGARQPLPGVYTDGTVPLAQFTQRDLAAQTWATQGWRMATFGAVLKSELDGAWQLTSGLFHSKERDPWLFSPYLQVNAGGNADSSIDVTPPLEAASTSGEMRVGNDRLQLAIRGRSVVRTYGGDDLLDLGNIALEDQTQFAQPPIELGPHSEDRTRQLDVGATYQERWTGVGSAALGVLKDNYRRTADVPSFASETYRTTPWLLNGRFTLEGGRGMLYYASYTQGLEDSALAPVTAVNRGEAPDASRTWQVDGGVRYAPDADLHVILGFFDIHKPYLNLDAAGVYRPLGRLRNEGIETSVAYNRSGLTLLVGGVLIRPDLQLDQPQTGIGSTPLGPVPLTLTANLDYAPARFAPWAASLQWNRLSPREATSDALQQLPAIATLGAGLRYQWARHDYSWTLRLDCFNLTNAEGLHVSALGLVVPEQSRRFALTLATDI